MKAFKFSFLLVRDEYFHGEQHDLLLLKNQAFSMITGIDIGLYLLRADLAASSALEKPAHDFLNPSGSIHASGFGTY
ncbi:hypothetical protein WAC87_004511 [Shigella flexneri]